jgi:ribbon-helix-helix CopG family protein
LDDEQFRDLRSQVDETIAFHKNKGFKSNNKVYRRVFNKSSKESRAIDKFGDSYFFTSSEDETISISITLPKSLVEEVNKYCKKKGITRSRLIRKLIEYSLDLKKTQD